MDGRAINPDVTSEGASVDAERLNNSTLDHGQRREVNEASSEKRKVRSSTRSADDPILDLLRAVRRSSITSP